MFADPHDSPGEGYRAIGEKQLAVEHYAKARAPTRNSEKARTTLERLAAG